jgi:hypothetical protein
MLMREAAITESFEFARSHLADAWPFLDRFEGLATALSEARKRFPERRQILEFGLPVEAGS